MPEAKGPTPGYDQETSADNGNPVAVMERILNSDDQEKKDQLAAVLDISSDDVQMLKELKNDSGMPLSSTEKMKYVLENFAKREAKCSFIPSTPVFDIQTISFDKIHDNQTSKFVIELAKFVNRPMIKDSFEKPSERKRWRLRMQAIFDTAFTSIYGQNRLKWNGLLYIFDLALFFQFSPNENIATAASALSEKLEEHFPDDPKVLEELEKPENQKTFEGKMTREEAVTVEEILDESGSVNLSPKESTYSSYSTEEKIKKVNEISDLIRNLLQVIAQETQKGSLDS